METFGKICFGIIVIIFSCVVGGYVFKTLWAWFIVPTFNAPVLSIAQAIGIMSILNYTKPKTKDTDKERTATEVFVRGLFEVVLYAIVALLFGWIVHLFM